MTIAQARSFSKASKELFLTPQSLTQQIDKMEAELTVRLFDRTRNGVSLTVAGQQYYQDAQRILDLLESSKSRAIAAARRPENVTVCHWHDPGVVRVGEELALRCPSIGQNHLNCAMAPQSDIESLEAHEMDLLSWIGGPDIPYDDLVFSPLTPTHVVLIVSRSHPLANAGKVSVADLDGLTITAGVTYWYPRLMRDFAQDAPNARICLVADNDGKVIETCMHGGIWLDCLGEREPASPVDVRNLAVVGLPEVYDSWWGFLHHSQMTRAAQVFLDLAVELYRPDAC